MDDLLDQLLEGPAPESGEDRDGYWSLRVRVWQHRPCGSLTLLREADRGIDDVWGPMDLWCPACRVYRVGEVAMGYTAPCPDCGGPLEALSIPRCSACGEELEDADLLAEDCRAGTGEAEARRLLGEGIASRGGTLRLWFSRDPGMGMDGALDALRPLKAIGARSIGRNADGSTFVVEFPFPFGPEEVLASILREVFASILRTGAFTGGRAEIVPAPPEDEPVAREMDMPWPPVPGQAVEVAYMLGVLVREDGTEGPHLVAIGPVGSGYGSVETIESFDGSRVRFVGDDREYVLG